MMGFCERCRKWMTTKAAKAVCCGASVLFLVHEVDSQIEAATPPYEDSRLPHGQETSATEPVGQAFNPGIVTTTPPVTGWGVVAPAMVTRPAMWFPDNGAVIVSHPPPPTDWQAPAPVVIVRPPAFMPQSGTVIVAPIMPHPVNTTPDGPTHPGATASSSVSAGG